ncbi:hypothetical protein NLU13_1837 [Sarocladium strictum]|uniref:CN hydrolase domain-containing protein n=1 Tax=Sarocladium strictum TaxID=5046 RepID=A0AA39LC55_SARSR|nr:hypothetical protein NLU13_1837 [Sarocladium strictum]
MRIACLQFAPQVGDVDNNLNRADSILSRVDPKDLDLLVLPELAFTGYNFKSLQQIAPFLEPPGSGISSLWARTTALKYECTVITGYPEKVDPSLKWPTDPEYYNAALVVSPDGETTANYRKSHLYYTDETWALEGHGFFAGRLPGLGKTAIGICMDINPYKFQVPWQNFEFAYHILENSVRLVIVSMAWITQEEPQTYTQTPDEPDMDTLTYWLARLDPVIRAEPDHEIIVVFANRCGQEGEATYAGTSAVVGIKGTDVKVYGILGRGQKDLLVVDTNDPPYAKLVFRPTENVPAEEDEPASSGASSQPGSTSHRESKPSQDAPQKASRDHSTTIPDSEQSGDSVHPGSTDSSFPVRQEITVPEKSDRRSTLVAFSPIEDRRGFFNEKGSPISPTYEEQHWWPSPFSQSTHRRYHSTSSLGRVNDTSRRRRVKTLQDRSSIGSALSDKTSSRRTAKWLSTSSNPIQEYAGHGAAVSRDALSTMEAAQYGAQSPMPTEHALDEYLEPSTQGFSALSIGDIPHSQRKSKLPLKVDHQSSPSESHPRQREQLRRRDDDQHNDATEGEVVGHEDVEAWLNQAGGVSSVAATQVGRPVSSGLKKTKARKERPSYINDWDEPRSYSPMEFRTPRAMTFEEIGALTASVST